MRMAVPTTAAIAAIPMTMYRSCHHGGVNIGEKDEAICLS